MKHTQREGLALGTTGAELPDPGKDRFWRVEVIKNVDRNPIKVTLMERIDPSTKFGSPLAHARTVAVPSKIAAAAEKLMEDVSHYSLFVGEYRVSGNEAGK